MAFRVGYERDRSAEMKRCQRHSKDVVETMRDDCVSEAGTASVSIVKD